MTGKVLNLEDIIFKDQLGDRIAQFWQEWNTYRQTKINDWDEVRRYVFATDTTQTTNSSLPWKNKTTVPKLTQIRDNLFANYLASLFPKRKWLMWDADDEDSDSQEKREAIRNYMMWAIKHPQFKEELKKLVLDYIDFGNAFAMPEMIDETTTGEDGQISGFVGPSIRRISPLDIVFNPIAPSFAESPKIIRSLVSLGEVKSILDKFHGPDRKGEAEELWKYFKDVRQEVNNFTGDISEKDSYLAVDGFTSFRNYLESDYMELLTFYGDIYDHNSGEFYHNHVITVADRHKVVYNEPNPSYFGHPPIYHVGWRKRQDNLWAMGPLDNLVGMQYRIDHIENLKADVFDLIGFPVFKIKGNVDDFEWGPGERIYVDEEGDVELLMPPYQALQANTEIEILESRMEELSGSPREAMGFRTPGEKTAYEVQRLENAASRIFQSKINQFEEEFLERLLNAMLELGRRQSTAVSVQTFDDEFGFSTWQRLSPQDITGVGRIKPVAARHFAERAERIQNLTNFYSSAIGQDPQVLNHFSSLETAKMMEDLLEIQEYGIVQENVRITEQIDAQRLAQSGQEDLEVEAQTPSGLAEDDFDDPLDETS